MHGVGGGGELLEGEDLARRQLEQRHGGERVVQHERHELVRRARLLARVPGGGEERDGGGEAAVDLLEERAAGGVRRGGEHAVCPRHRGDPLDDGVLAGRLVRVHVRVRDRDGVVLRARLPPEPRQRAGDAQREPRPEEQLALARHAGDREQDEQRLAVGAARHVVLDARPPRARDVLLAREPPLDRRAALALAQRARRRPELRRPPLLRVQLAQRRQQQRALEARDRPPRTGLEDAERPVHGVALGLRQRELHPQRDLLRVDVRRGRRAVLERAPQHAPRALEVPAREVELRERLRDEDRLVLPPLALVLAHEVAPDRDRAVHVVVRRRERRRRPHQRVRRPLVPQLQRRDRRVVAQHAERVLAVVHQHLAELAQRERPELRDERRAPPQLRALVEDEHRLVQLPLGVRPAVRLDRVQPNRQTDPRLVDRHGHAPVERRQRLGARDGVEHLGRGAALLHQLERLVAPLLLATVQRREREQEERQVGQRQRPNQCVSRWLVHIRIGVCICAFISLSVCISLFIFIGICIFISINVNISVNISVNACVSIFVSIFVCICVCICVHIL